VCKQAELSHELFFSLSVFVPTFVGFELKKAAGVKQLMKVKRGVKSKVRMQAGYIEIYWRGSTIAISDIAT
jgi:hypothetical protein